MGNLLRQVDDAEAAAQQLDEAVDGLGRLGWEGDPDLRDLGVTVLEARALARGEAGREDAITDLEAARLAALAGGEAWRAADLVDTRARIAVRLDRPEDGVKDFLEAADAYRAAGDPLAGGRSELLAARVLSGSLDRPDEARVILQAVRRGLTGADAPEGAPPLVEAVEAALAELA
jgi:hypothetical protein